MISLVCGRVADAGPAARRRLDLGQVLDLRSLALWETAARCFMYAALGQVAIGLTALHEAGRGFDAAAVCVLAGSLVFSGTVAAIALGGPRWLGAITPLGGTAMIVGFVLFAIAAFRTVNS